MIKILLAILAISGYIANIKDKKELSYYLWLGSNMGWYVNSILIKEYAMAVMFFIYALFCSYGLMRKN